MHLAGDLESEEDGASNDQLGLARLHLQTWFWEQIIPGRDEWGEEYLHREQLWSLCTAAGGPC